MAEAAAYSLLWTGAQSCAPYGPYAPWPALRAGRETLAVGGACLEATKDRRIAPTVLPRPAAVPHQAGDFGPLHRGPISRPGPTREPLLIGAPCARSAEPS